MNRPARLCTFDTTWPMPGGRKAAVVCTAPPDHRGRHRDPGIFLDDGRVLDRKLAEQVTDRNTRETSLQVIAEVDEHWALLYAKELRARSAARRNKRADRKRERQARRRR